MAQDKDRNRARKTRETGRNEAQFAAAAGEWVSGSDDASFYAHARQRQSQGETRRVDARSGASRDEGSRPLDMDDIARGYGVDRGGLYGSRSVYTGGGETDRSFRSRAAAVSPYFGDNLGTGADDSGRGSDLGPGIGANRAYGYGSIPSYGNADVRGPVASAGYGSPRRSNDRSNGRGDGPDRGAASDYPEATFEHQRYERQRAQAADQPFDRGSVYGTVNLPPQRGARAAPGRSDRRARASRWRREPLTARDIMTRDVKSVHADANIRDAAKIMRDENAGVVPVVNDDDTLCGVVTDRDIVMRSIAEGTDPMRLTAGELMTSHVDAATPDEAVVDVIRLMGDKQIRRVPVVDERDRLVGIISIADIATRADYDTDLQDALEEISLRRSFWTGLV